MVKGVIISDRARSETRNRTESDAESSHKNADPGF